MWAIYKAILDCKAPQSFSSYISKIALFLDKNVNYYYTSINLKTLGNLLVGG